MTFRAGADGLIHEQRYVPRAGQAKWEPYLAEALPWLRDHRGDALTRIYPKEKLNQSAAAAAEWVKVLCDWRAATGKPQRDVYGPSVGLRE